ncbi:hypothetical protein [Mobiluncus sp.]|uniref:hypothetical protein n=1 Tax=Mobiluncus sp. TaxID=47293 RepID=UPI002A90DA9C|nr:hypothetical protein [Mobiluncus sp.]
MSVDIWLTHKKSLPFVIFGPRVSQSCSPNECLLALETVFPVALILIGVIDDPAVQKIPVSTDAVSFCRFERRLICFSLLLA